MFVIFQSGDSYEVINLRNVTKIIVDKVILRIHPVPHLRIEFVAGTESLDYTGAKAEEFSVILFEALKLYEERELAIPLGIEKIAKELEERREEWARW